MTRLLACLVGSIALLGCETTGSTWSEEASARHIASLDALAFEALEREAGRVAAGGSSPYAPRPYVLYAYAIEALQSDDPDRRAQGMSALVIAALEGEETASYQLRPRAGGAPAVEPATVRRGGLPEAQYRLYQEWIDDPQRESEALLVLMQAALADYPPAVEAWEAEEQAGRFDGGRE